MYTIDARVRPPIPSYRESSIWNTDFAIANRRKRGYSADEDLAERSIHSTITSMTEAGITKAVVPGRPNDSVLGGGDNREVAALVRDMSPRFIGLFGVPFPIPADPSLIVNEVLEEGFAGVVLEPSLSVEPAYLDNRGLYPLYDAAEATNLVVYLMSGGSAGPSLDFINPTCIDRIAADFSDLSIVAVHGGWPFVQEMCGVAYRRSNVYLMPDLYFPGLPGEGDYKLALETYCQDRFLFGSSYPLSPFAERKAAYLNLGISESILEKVMGLNAARLFNIEPG